MQRLLLSLAVLAISHVGAFAAGDAPETPGTSGSGSALQFPGIGSDDPQFVFYPAYGSEVPIKVLVYDSDGNLERVQTATLPCIPNQQFCPFTHTGLTPEETQEMLELRITDTQPFNSSSTASDWNAFRSVP